MQTLMVKYTTCDGFNWYPALRGKRLGKKTVAERIAHLTRSQWNIVEHKLVEDGMTRAQDNTAYRSMCRAERRRGA